MWNNANVAPLDDRRYPIYSGEVTEVGDITHTLMAEEPDKIETWRKEYPKKELGFMTLLSVTNVNDSYAEKILTFKRFPNLFHVAAEKVEGRGKISFGHVKKDRAEINLTYFGDLLIGRMVHITDVTGAQTQHPVLM